jgi:adenosylcobinamide-GDP ribazoletransferase
MNVPARGPTLQLRSLRAALVFLTRIPMGGYPYTAQEWAWAPAYFPAVGLLVGALLAALHRVLWPLGPLPDAVAVIGASMLLTGALHEDGLADTVDALGGATDRERILEILKDSRIGSFGACALIVSAAGRIALLERLGPSAVWALPLAGCAARVAPVWQMALLPYASKAGAKSSHLAPTRQPQALVATAWFVAAWLLAGWARGPGPMRLLCLGAALGVTGWATAALYLRRLGGFTGDFLGATEQLGELVAYAVLAWGET